MHPTQKREQFRAILAGDQCIHPASVFDPLSVRIAEDLGYELAFMAGSTASATVLGAPDLVVLTLSEFAEQIRRICRAANIGLIVDADHGYGNALNVMRTVAELETAGLAGLTIEDTALPQGFGRAKGEDLITLEEGVGKMQAALAGRQDPTLVIIARTAALRAEGIDGTVRRVKAYAQTGVDAIWLAGGVTPEGVSAVHEAVGLPLLTGAGDMTDEFLTANGVRVAHQGHLPLAGAVKGMYDTLKALRDGVAPRDLRGSVATSEFMGQVTRKPDYDHWIQEYMN
ncbi:MAG TPA: isocitrate lyase/PEP mutase family protein [Candidatus Tectomicrobia bacterium]|jgi:oxaloacetate decarboxylase